MLHPLSHCPPVPSSFICKCCDEVHRADRDRVSNMSAPLSSSSTAIHSTQAVVERMWKWCASVGITSKHLSLRWSHETQRRGLFLEESVSAGAVLASIPYRACWNRELLFARCTRVPPAWMFARALRPRCLDNPSAVEALWLSSALVLHSEFFPREYFDLMPEALSIERYRFEARRVLAPKEASDLDDIERACRRHIQVITALLRRYRTLKRLGGAPIHLSAVSHAHDLVISRAVDIPWGCRKCAPQDLATFLDEHEVPTLPTLVPLLDMVNASSCRRHGESADAEMGGVAARVANCEVFTTAVKPFAHEGTRRVARYRSTSTERLDRARIVLCATQSIASGSEILLDYNVEDRPAAAFRHGFVD